MKTMQDTIKEMNEALKTAFGPANSCLVARCPAFGHADNAIIFRGPDCIEAAKDFLPLVCNGKVETSTREFMGLVSTSATVVWQ